MGSGGGGKVVMFCSAARGEGKTTLALGMAATATMNGLHAIVVDIDPHEGGAGHLSKVPDV